MPLTRRRSARPITELSERALEKRIADAQRVIREMPDNPPHAEMAKHLAVAEAAARERRAATAELQARAQAEREAQLGPLRRRQRLGSRSVQLQALDLVGRAGHRELHEVTLVAARLSEQEGKELLQLASRRIAGEERLGETEITRYEALIGKSAADEGLFARKRTEQAETDKLAALRAAERRLPMADSLVAACLAEDDLVDGLRRKLRPDAVVVDEYGREVPGATAEPIYSFENISALHVVLSLITANGGEPVIIGEHGLLAADLPRLPEGALSQLRRNGWLTTSQEGTGVRVGLGERTRNIAAKWGIELPSEDGD